jgi:hypothetical protein
MSSITRNELNQIIKEEVELFLGEAFGDLLKRKTRKTPENYFGDEFEKDFIDLNNLARSIISAVRQVGGQDFVMKNKGIIGFERTFFSTLGDRSHALNSLLNSAINMDKGEDINESFFDMFRKKEDPLSDSSVDVNTKEVFLDKSITWDKVSSAIQKRVDLIKKHYDALEDIIPNDIKDNWNYFMREWNAISPGAKKSKAIDDALSYLRKEKGV